MIVCSCNVLSDGQIQACLNPGESCPRTAAQVYQCLGCSPKCGKCARTIRAIVRSALEATAPSLATCGNSCTTVCGLSGEDDHRHSHVASTKAPAMAGAE